MEADQLHAIEISRHTTIRAKRLELKPRFAAATPQNHCVAVFNAILDL